MIFWTRDKNLSGRSIVAEKIACGKKFARREGLYSEKNPAANIP